MPATPQKNGAAQLKQNANEGRQLDNEIQSYNAAKKSAHQKAWLVIGKMRYGTKKTEDELDKRAADILAHPYSYGIDVRGKRVKYEDYDYIRVIYPKDIMFVFDISLRQAQRLLKDTRRRLKKEKTDYVTVEEYCVLHKHVVKDVKKKICSRKR